METRALSPRWRLIPIVAALGALAVLLTGGTVAFLNERLYERQKLREAQVQAQILAASVTAALVFEDQAAAHEYVGALRVNPEVMAAGVYGRRGLVAGFARPGEPALPPDPDSDPGADPARRLTVSATVAQGEMVIGNVLLRMEREPAQRRLARYGGIGLLVVMACLVLGVLAAAQAALAKANRALAVANRDLRQQIQEREKAEAALRQTQKMEAIGQLTGGVAHDFNNLLQALAGCLSLVRKRARNPALDPLLDAGQQAVDRGAKLTQQLLAFARRQALRPEPTDVRDRLLGMSELLARALRADIALELDLAAGLWPVEVDPTQLELAILNLAVNARDAMPNGGQLRVEGANCAGLPADPGEGLAGGDYVRLVVRDNGTGMEPAVLARVFEPFFTTKAMGKGSGLGLSQVYGFARQSGGTVRIDSAPGVGTAVTLLLPRSSSQPAQAQAAATVQDGTRAGRLLLVEDDPVVGAVLADALLDMGFAVQRATTADEALSLLAGGAALDLMLTDVVMPGKLTGVDLALEATRQRPGLPVVLMTGYSEQVAAGTPFTVLPKPFQMDDLVAALDRALGRNPIRP